MKTQKQNHDLPNHDLTLQRCVDGELDEALQVKLIKELDAATDQTGWRELALQYMEQQVLRDTFSDSQPSSAAHTAENRVVTDLQPKRRLHFTKLVSTATALALGLVLGTNLNSKSPLQVQPQLAETQVAEVSPTRISPTFDIYEYPSDEMFYQEVILPADLHRKIEDAGYVIERKCRSFRVPTSDGNEIMVPSDTIRIRNMNR